MAPVEDRLALPVSLRPGFIVAVSEQHVSHVALHE